MRLNVHWRDLLIGVAGLWLIASPSIIDYQLNNTAISNAYGVGCGLIVFCILSAWRLQDLGNEIVNIVFGCWLVLSPYALGFSRQQAVTLNAIIAGLIVVALAIWDLYSIPKSS